VTSERYPKIWRDKDENFFFNSQMGTKEVFPSLYDPWSVHLSIIIPSYNEEHRCNSLYIIYILYIYIYIVIYLCHLFISVFIIIVSPMLDECLEYLEELTKSEFTYEVIIVSDGSTDKTVDIAQNYASKYSTIRVLNLVKNRGKGGAVRLVNIFDILNQRLI